jgi:hypothetical protein
MTEKIIESLIVRQEQDRLKRIYNVNPAEQKFVSFFSKIDDKEKKLCYT